jgi:D-alanyl-lipoteichoic acid acyltransferase DltB (MBOAT superfamily)
LLSSYLFYSFWSVKFLYLLVIITVLDYLYAFAVDSKNIKIRRLFLVLSILNNFGVLFYFKYFNFFSTEFYSLWGFITRKELNPFYVNILLPVGISFYTFHGMSYIIDIYNKKRAPTINFVNYSLFVSFFPLLVAGPIERANHLLPQIENKRQFNYNGFIVGLRLILFGLFKKVVLADNLSFFVDEIYKNPSGYNSFVLILASVAFSFQIYGDFSGYSDIALGTANLFGFNLLSNFRFPYFSMNISEFWKKWHISLSSWFKDYLYFPLGGSRGSFLNNIRNIFIIFLVSGFWHGANWTFILWGVLHALAYVLYFIYNRFNFSFFANKFIAILTTFSFVTFSWIFFRSSSIGQARLYLDSICTNFNLSNNFSFVTIIKVFILILIFLAFDFLFKNNERQPNFEVFKNFRFFVYLVITIAILLNMNNNSSFIYFQF